MRIISDFHDYYDSIANIGGHDNTIVYERHEDDEAEIDNPFFAPSFTQRDWQRNIPANNCFYVIFCGKLHFVIEDNPTYHWELNQQIMDSRIYRWNNFEHYKSLQKERQGKYSYYSKYDRFGMFMDFFDKDYTEMCVNTGSPIIKFECFANEKVHSTINPKLRDIGFASVIDPYTAFQTLEHFVDTHFTRKVDMTKVSEKDRFVEHGFDAKTSFRKDPWKRLKGKKE